MNITLLGIAALVLASAVILIQMRRGKIFTLLTFYTALFLLEVPGGALKAVRTDIFPDVAAQNQIASPLPWVPAALVASLVSYLIFLAGYLGVMWVRKARAARSEETPDRFFERWWTPPFTLLLFIATIVAIFAGLGQQLARMIAAGGVMEFIQNAYDQRVGTATEGAAGTAIVVLSNLIGNLAVPLTLLWIMAWLRGRLTRFEKGVVVGLVVILLLRQWATMFRASLIFTLVALIAVYASERRVKLKQLAIAGASVLGVLIIANYIHYYMYYLTAGWNRPRLWQSLQLLIAPHGHIHSLSQVIRAHNAGVPHLHGQGLIESVFFFIPRSIWETKLDSTAYGAMLVQKWAGLPTHFQMAITAVGEWLAHFGWTGIAGMALLGAIYATVDTFADRGVVGRAALFGIAMARVLADIGMGISALAITLFCLVLFAGQIYVLKGAVLLWERMVRRR